MLQPTPKLFDIVPRALFTPLGDRYAELYWAVLARLYQHEFEREPFLIVRDVAWEVAERVVLDSPLWADRREELVRLGDEAAPDGGTATARIADVGNAREDDSAKALARRLIARLERSGWVHWQFRSGAGEVLSFHPHAARVLETLMRVARDEQPILQGYVHSIAALLDARSFAAKPGLSLAEAKRDTLELVRELKILERNIHLFTQRILEEAASAAKVLEEGLDRYKQAVMANYHRLKTVDNVFRQRGAILSRIAAIERDVPGLEAAARWYGEQYGQDSQSAQVAVQDDLALIRSQFESIPQITDEIDARNARFSGITLRKLMYLLRQDRKTEGQLQYLVDALARGEAPELEFDVFRCELLADGFLYTAPRDRERAAPQPIRRRERGDPAVIRAEAHKRVQRLFGRRRIEEFVASFLGGRDSASLRELSVDSDDEFVRLLYLAAYGLDRGCSFELKPEASRVRKGPYGFPDGQLAKRQRRGSRGGSRGR